MKNKLMRDKRGVVWFLWAGAALVAGVGYLISQLKPAPTGIAAIPVWGWVIGGLVLLILMKK